MVDDQRLTLTAYPRHYLGAEFDPSDWSDIEPVLTELSLRDLPDLTALRQWLNDWSEVSDMLDETGVLREIAKDQNIQDEEIRQDYLDWVEKIQPRIKPFYFEFQRKLADNPLSSELDSDCHQFLRQTRNQLTIFNSANVTLEAECDRLVADYYKLRGAQDVDWDATNPDRTIRESTYRLMMERRWQDHDAMDSIIDPLLSLRQDIARNAGFDDYRAFRWQQLNRCDYSPDDCLDMVDAVEKTVVPRLHLLDRRHAGKLGASKLRDWDLGVDPSGLPPLKPFETVDEWILKTRSTLHDIDSRLGDCFELMVNANLVDLEQRPDKADFVGYQQFLRARRIGFIFLYPRFSHSDVEGLMHECGHALHTLSYRDQQLTWNRSAPLEFAEAIARGTEIIGSGYLEGAFYNAPDRARARIQKFEGILINLVCTARGEAFLHWLHTSPGHTSKQRSKTWMELGDRLGRDLDWSGLESHYGYTWVYDIPHLFFGPFYWIEYLFGQVGGLQLWRTYRADPTSTFDHLCKAMSLGNTVSPRELFDITGMKFDITVNLLDELMDLVEEELDKLYDQV